MHCLCRLISIDFFETYYKIINLTEKLFFAIEKKTMINGLYIKRQRFHLIPEFQKSNGVFFSGENNLLGRINGIEFSFYLLQVID